MGKTSNKRAGTGSRTCIGKVRHPSFKSAKKSIAQQYDRELRPYQCGVCRGVHLTSGGRP